MPEDGVIRSRIFDGLTDRDRIAWLDAGRRMEVRAGHVVARQGEPADTFYIVDSGLLKLSQLTPDGREVIVRLVESAEPFGGIVAIREATYPVTALVAARTRLFAWPRAVFAPLLDRFPQVRSNITREIATHMTDALERVRELATERVGQRLAHVLLRLLRHSGRSTPQGIEIVHPLTRQELAELTGSTLYTVSRTLSRWELDGIVGRAGRRLVVRSPKRLEALTRTGS